MMYCVSLHALGKGDKFFEFRCVVFMNVSTGKTILMDGNDIILELWNDNDILKIKSALV